MEVIATLLLFALFVLLIMIYNWSIGTLVPDPIYTLSSLDISALEDEDEDHAVGPEVEEVVSNDVTEENTNTVTETCSRVPIRSLVKVCDMSGGRYRRRGRPHSSWRRRRHLRHWGYPRLSRYLYYPSYYIPDYNTCRNYADLVCRNSVNPSYCYGWAYDNCRYGNVLV